MYNWYWLYLQLLRVVCSLIVINCLLSHSVCVGRQMTKLITGYKTRYNKQGCCRLPSVKFGYFDLSTKDVITKGTQASLRCCPGYQTAGSSLVKCQKNKRWSIPTGQCIARKCDMLPIDANGNFIIHDGGQFAALVCNVDYKITLNTGGIPVISCQDNNKWSTPTATCFKPECDLLPIDANGNFIIHDGGQFAALVCNADYKITLNTGGSPGISCQDNNKWSTPTAICFKPECDLLPIDANGNFIIHDGGQFAALVCNADSKITLNTGGSPGITCQDNNKWSTPTAICFKPVCPPLPVKNDGEYIQVGAENFNVGAIATFRCYPPRRFDVNIQFLTIECKGAEPDWSPRSDVTNFCH